MAVSLKGVAKGDPFSKEANMSEEEEVVYCICRKKYDGSFMICCDGCKDWFHGR